MNPTNKPSAPTFELMPTETASLSAIVKAEIDTQIATAHAYPRNMTTFQARAIDMVGMDEETAESCIYCRPVGKDQYGKEKFAEGLSIRMAEIVAACYGNLRSGAQLISQTPHQVVARGFAHDLESNNAGTSECVEATTKRDGSPVSSRQQVVIAKAALAKARRDAIFAVVPRALCKKIEAEARKVIAGSKKPLNVRRQQVSDWVSKLNIEPARVWVALGVKGPDDLTEENLVTLTGIRTAMKEGDTNVDEAFPPIVKSKDAAQDKEKDTDNVNTTGATPIGHIQNCVLIRKGLEAADVSEAEFLAYLKANGVEVAATLNDSSPDAIANVLKNFDGVITAVIALKQPAEKQPVTAPKKVTAKTTETAKSPTQSYNYLKALKGLLKISGIDEDKLIIWTRGMGLTEESLSTLDEVNEAQPSVIVKLHDEWMKGIKDQVLAATSGAKAAPGELL